MQGRVHCTPGERRAGRDHWALHKGDGTALWLHGHMCTEQVPPLSQVLKIARLQDTKGSTPPLRTLRLCCGHTGCIALYQTDVIKK